MEIKQRLGELELVDAIEGVTGRESVIQYSADNGNEYLLWDYKPTKEWVREWEETRKDKQFLYGLMVRAYPTGETGDEVGEVDIMLTIIEYEEVDGKLEYVGAGYWPRDSRFNDIFKGETIQDLYDELVYQVEEVLEGGRAPVMDNQGITTNG